VEDVVIYTDGACAGNGTANARGGWAAVVNRPGSEPLVLSGGEKPATNQRMEILAAINGLEALAEPSKVTLYADSAYLVNCFNQEWHHKWRSNGWLGSAKKPVVNRDLWEALLDLVETRGHEVIFRRVDGHADKKRGHVSTEHERFNQLCDELAVGAVPD
jgi:ribonuclease HI